MGQVKADRLTFERCARGFLVATGGYDTGLRGELYAFDRIEDVGRWIVEHYSEPPLELTKAVK